MKPTTYFLSFLLVALFLYACQQTSLDQADAAQVQENTQASSTALSDLSVYQLASDWTNQDGKPVTLQEFAGKPVLVSMVYTSCAFACPRTLADMQQIEKGLADYNTRDFRMLLVTIDPERDTPAQLSAFAGQHDLNLLRWSLLTSEPAQIQELAAVLNVKYRKALQGEFAHSNLITVLNQKGEIVHQQQGLGAAPEETINKVRELLGPL